MKPISKRRLQDVAIREMERSKYFSYSQSDEPSYSQETESGRDHKIFFDKERGGYEKIAVMMTCNATKQC